MRYLNEIFRLWKNSALFKYIIAFLQEISDLIRTPQGKTLLFTSCRAPTGCYFIVKESADDG